MAEALADQIMNRVEQVENLYHRLVVVVAPSGGGKTEALRDVAERAQAPLININLELSRRMLDLTERQRALKACRILAEIVEETGAPLVLLATIGVLFDPALRQDPIRVLQSVSRNRTIVVAWNGTAQDGHLLYAEPGHPEYARAPAKDFLYIYGGTAAGS